VHGQVEDRRRRIRGHGKEARAYQGWAPPSQTRLQLVGLARLHVAATVNESCQGPDEER